MFKRWILLATVFTMLVGYDVQAQDPEPEPGLDPEALLQRVRDMRAHLRIERAEEEEEEAQEQSAEADPMRQLLDEMASERVGADTMEPREGWLAEMERYIEARHPWPEVDVRDYLEINWLNANTRILPKPATGEDNRSLRLSIYVASRRSEGSDVETFFRLLPVDPEENPPFELKDVNDRRQLAELQRPLIKYPAPKLWKFLIDEDPDFFIRRRGPYRHLVEDHRLVFVLEDPSMCPAGARSSVPQAIREEDENRDPRRRSLDKNTGCRGIGASKGLNDLPIQLTRGVDALTGESWRAVEAGTGDSASRRDPALVTVFGPPNAQGEQSVYGVVSVRWVRSNGMEGKRPSRQEKAWETAFYNGRLKLVHKMLKTWPRSADEVDPANMATRVDFERDGEPGSGESTLHFFKNANYQNPAYGPPVYVSGARLLGALFYDFSYKQELVRQGRFGGGKPLLIPESFNVRATTYYAFDKKGDIQEEMKPVNLWYLMSRPGVTVDDETECIAYQMCMQSELEMTWESLLEYSEYKAEPPAALQAAALKTPFPEALTEGLDEPFELNIDEINRKRSEKGLGPLDEDQSWTLRALGERLREMRRKIAGIHQAAPYSAAEADEAVGEYSRRYRAEFRYSSLDYLVALERERVLGRGIVEAPEVEEENEFLKQIKALEEWGAEMQAAPGFEVFLLWWVNDVLGVVDELLTAPVRGNLFDGLLEELSRLLGPENLQLLTTYELEQDEGEARYEEY